VTVQVEALSGEEQGTSVHDRVRTALRGGLGVNPEVEVLAAGSLPRLEQAKAKRVLDRRAAGPTTRRGAT
jgi:phenylacetate-coenzyme A ligase PaaK-like adenylate-forming protein